MNLNFRGISRVISAFTAVLGAAMFPSAIVALIYGEKEVFIFVALGTVLIILGQVLLRSIKPSPVQFKIRDGFLIVFLCWILAGLFGALPYLLSGCAGPVNSIFESFSGLTTTGATIFDDVETLPKSILFWRSFSQWIGGFGVVFIPIALLPSLGIEGSVIVRAEMSGTYVNRVKPKLSDTARRMFLILTVLTLLETVCLMFGNLNFFDALTHSFTTLSTGGFTNYNDNLGHFGSTYVYCVFSLFMLIAGMDVTTQAKIFAGKFYEVYKDVELRVYLILFSLATGIIMIYLLLTDTVSSIFRAFTQSAFHVLATLSTAGFYSADFDSWGLFPVLILIVLMFIGGCISSTSGGIKVYRAFILLKMVKRGILLRLHPNAIIDMKVEGKRVPSATASAVTGFIFMYVDLLRKYNYAIEVMIEKNAYMEASVLENLSDYGLTDGRIAYLLSTRKPVPDIYSFLNTHKSEISNIIIDFPNQTERDMLMDVIEKMDIASVTNSMPTNIELGGPGTSKAGGLLALGQILGVKPDEMMAIGDSANDIAMLEACGLAVAMGNATPEVLKTADYVTLSNAEHGVAHAIKKFVL